MQKLLLLIALSFFGSSTIQAAAPTPQKTAIPTLKITHTTVATLPPARTVIRLPAKRVAMLKAQSKEPFNIRRNSDTNQAPENKLVEALRARTTPQILVIAQPQEDSFFLGIHITSTKQVVLNIQTTHAQCPTWIEFLIKHVMKHVDQKTPRGHNKLFAAGATLAITLGSAARWATLKNPYHEQSRLLEASPAIITTENQTLGPDSPTIQAGKELPPATPSSESESDEVTNFQKKFKHFLTTTPFWRFIANGATEEPPSVFKQIPGRDGMHRLCPCYNETLLDSEIHLSREQFSIFLNGSFKESTVDLLAQFQRNYFIQLAREGDGRACDLKLAAIAAFSNEISKIDPVEAKRILCFHPLIVYELASQTNVEIKMLPPIRTKTLCYGQSYDVVTGRRPHAQIPPRDPRGLAERMQKPQTLRENEKRCFGHALHDGLLPNDAGGYCLGHDLTCDMALFQDLDLVSAAA